MSNHDVIVRIVELLPEGVAEPDWPAARARLASLTEEQIIREVPWCPALGEADDPRRFLEAAINDLAGAWHDSDDVPDGLSFERLAEPWHGRTGFISSGTDWDATPARVGAVVALDDLDILAAAGFERLP